MYPLRLAPSWREKIWGSNDLRPLFGESSHKIGEVWFTFEENTVVNGPWAGRNIEQLMARHGPSLMGTAYRPYRPGYFPLLVKYLFTSEKLSVQVHPDDAYAFAHENGPGKTEMWYILRADPDASLALGLNASLSRDLLCQAARTGEIERYLRWVPVQPGDVVFCPAGTIHAIGPGLALCEIQQNSDITYRLYDYGRGRELHLDRAVTVASVDSHLQPLRPASDILVACDYFAVERMRRSAASAYESDPARLHILVFLEGHGSLEGEPYHPGDVYLVPASLGAIEWHPAEPTLALRASVPGE